MRSRILLAVVLVAMIALRYACSGRRPTKQPRRRPVAPVTKELVAGHRGRLRPEGGTAATPAIYHLSVALQLRQRSGKTEASGYLNLTAIDAQIV